MNAKRIGILTGGGDCPGLNAVIRAVTKTAIFDYHLEVIGIHDGYRGLLEEHTSYLTAKDTSGILSKGGTILGTSNHDNPFRVPIGKDQYEDHSDRAIATVSKLGLDVLLCVGGDGTMHIAHGLFKKGVPVIGIPKTIDNDLSATDQTFGFDSAVSIISQSLDNLHCTAQSHHRVMIVETMGRYAGWLALAGGIAGGADVILIPEIPYQLENIVKALEARKSIGKRFSIIAVAEGAKAKGGQLTVQSMDATRTDPVLLGGIAQRLAKDLNDLQGPECRTVVLGHLQRGGSPTAFDRLLGTRYGVEAVHFAVGKKFGSMVSLQGKKISYVPIQEAIGKLRTVPIDDPLILAAKSVGTSFGE